MLGVLGGVAAIAVVAGRLANNDVFWAAAGSVFFLACAGLVAYAAKGLGVAAETADFLRAHYVWDEATPEEKKQDKAKTILGGTRVVYRPEPRELTEAEEEWLAANVLKREDSADNRAPSPEEVGWIIQNLRRAMPPREQSAKEWVRRYIDPASPSAQRPRVKELSAQDLAWLIENVRSRESKREDEEAESPN